ncbi:hypothetical protein CLIB1423_03S06502 [[Candida] railenensis]|uniref:Rho-GAP domain-containing protein n=1 Tax=[Candida] railenensis TaxID=45579 RepID=A0A9P0QMI3_9ASCO|nr:hypothetical protein CLIB1423_03S06502 [[Candida] railenensis]
MSHSSSPTNRNSIFGWVKNLKRGGLLSSDSVNDISDKEDNFNFNNNNNSEGGNVNSSAGYAAESTISSPASIKQSAQDFLRPSLLHHKSRSANNVNRIRSNSLNQSDKSLRQHRDSFLQHNPLVDENSKYFGVPLEDAVNQACAKISILTSDPGNVLQYGRIPIVVAKCAIYIKKNGLNVEGIFRVGGSSKRLKELQLIFNAPPEFGKKLNWDGYTVHDASSILRRFLNALPEPLIPLDLYEQFRDPLRERQRIISYMKYKAENPKPKQNESVATGVTESAGAAPAAGLTVQSHVPPTSSVTSPLQTPVENPIDEPASALLDTTSEPLTEANIDRLNSSAPQNEIQECTENPSTSGEVQETKSTKKTKNYKKLTKEVHEAIEIYKERVDRLPELSKQLLFYILDLLAMVQTQSSENLMSSRNLAAIFQPSILSHPNHDLDPVEYALSQSVVEFLIRYAYKLLPNQNGDDPIATEDPTPNGKEEEVKLKTEGAEEMPPPQVSHLSASPGSDKLSAPSGQKSPFNRHHSKSVSSSQSHDMVGYSGGAKRLPIVDSDNEYNSIDFDISDDDELSSNLNKSNITVDSGYKVNNKNIDSVLNELDKEAVANPDTTINDTTLTGIQNEDGAESKESSGGGPLAIIVEPPVDHVSEPL